MSDSEPRPQSEPVRKRIDGPPKPPTKTTLDLMGDGGGGNLDIEMATAVTDAIVAYGDLLKLNGGGRPEKREGLESSLDRSVVLLSKLAPKMQGPNLGTITSTLLAIRGYRRRFPRIDASDLERAEEARRILHELPEA